MLILPGRQELSESTTHTTAGVERSRLPGNISMLSYSMKCILWDTSCMMPVMVLSMCQVTVMPGICVKPDS